MHPTTRILLLSFKLRGVDETRRRRQVAAAVARGGLALHLLSYRVPAGSQRRPHAAFHVNRDTVS